MEMQLPKSRRCYTWTPTKNTKVCNMHTHKHMYTHTFSTSGRYSCRAFVSDDLIPSTLSTSHFKNSWLSRRFSCARHNSNHKVHVNLYHNNQCQQSIFFSYLIEPAGEVYHILPPVQFNRAFLCCVLTGGGMTATRVTVMSSS